MISVERRHVDFQRPAIDTQIDPGFPVIQADRIRRTLYRDEITQFYPFIYGYQRSLLMASRRPVSFQELSAGPSDPSTTFRAGIALFASRCFTMAAKAAAT